MAFMDFLNRLAASWNEGASQGLTLDWAQRQSLEQERRRMKELLPLQLEAQAAELQMKQPYLLEQLRMRQALKTPTVPKRNLIASKGLIYDADNDRWIKPPEGMATEETGGLAPALSQIVGYDVTKGRQVPGTPPWDPELGAEGNVPWEKPDLMTEYKKARGIGPGQQAMVGTMAGGGLREEMRDRPVPAGDLNRWAREEADRLVREEGWDPATAWTAVTAVVDDYTARRAGKRQAAATQADITTRYGTPANVQAEAGAKGRIGYATGAGTAQGAADVANRPGLPVGGAYGPPGGPVSPAGAVIPKPTAQGEQPPPGLSQDAMAAWRRSRATQEAENVSAALRADTAATLLVNKQLQDIEESPDLETYGWSIQQWMSKGRDFLAGATHGFISPDTAYNNFRQKTRNIRLQAFDFGGKQLTNTEKEFVLETVPDGSENTPVELRAKIAGLRERRELLLKAWQKFANLPVAQYEAAVNQMINEYRRSKTTTYRYNRHGKEVK